MSGPVRQKFFRPLPALDLPRMPVSSEAVVFRRRRDLGGGLVDSGIDALQRQSSTKK
jgi:hypothetical protein